MSYAMNKLIVENWMDEVEYVLDKPHVYIIKNKVPIPYAPSFIHSQAIELLGVIKNIKEFNGRKIETIVEIVMSAASNEVGIILMDEGALDSGDKEKIVIAELYGMDICEVICRLALVLKGIGPTSDILDAGEIKTTFVLTENSEIH